MVTLMTIWEPASIRGSASTPASQEPSLGTARDRARPAACRPDDRNPGVRCPLIPRGEGSPARGTPEKGTPGNAADKDSPGKGASPQGTPTTAPAGTPPSAILFVPALPAPALPVPAGA